MDKIDNKIMRELDINPKESLSQIGNRLRISQQTADYRIKRLISNSEILKFGTIINLKSLGYEHYRIFLKFNKSDYSSKEIFSYLKNQKGVYWASRVGGKYDLHLTLFVKDFEEFDKFIDHFNENFPGLIKDYKSEYVLKHILYNHKYISDKPKSVEYGYNDKIQKIDDLDEYILGRIKNNCRLSSLELSKGKKVSYKTISNRIKNLEKRNIILSYRMFVNSRDKKPYILLISFKDYSKNKENKLISDLGIRKEVTQIMRLFGNWNLYLHIRAENEERLQDLIIDLRDKYSIIDNFEVIPVFEDISIDTFPL